MTRALLTGVLASLAAGVLSAQPAPRLVRSRLVWVDRAGARQSTIGTLGDYGNIELSPDRHQIAAAVLNDATGRRELWLYDAGDGHRSRLDANVADENWLVWSPDGKRVVFNSQRKRGLDIYGREETGNDIWVMPMTEGRKPYPFLKTEAQENWAAFSPNGKWVAYSYKEAGSDTELYVTSFPKPGRRYLVHARGGFQARWRRDGRELFFLATNGTLTTSLMVADVSSDGAEFEVNSVKKLFDTPVPYPPYHAFDVSTDGQRILMNSLLLGPDGAGRAAH